MSDEIARPLVSVCVGSIRGATLPRLVASIQAQIYPAWELIVSVQGSDPALLEYVGQIDDPRIRILELDDFGRSRALNAAVHHAAGEILAFTDDDCEAADDWLHLMTQAFDEHPAVGIVAGSLLPPERPRFRISVCPATHVIDSLFDPALSPEGPDNGFYWGGGNFAVARWAYEKIGPFDDHLGVGTDYQSAEDVDYALRAELCDVPTLTRPSIIVTHTYGSRVGLRATLAHHRGYARGSGALGVKVQRMNHRLASEWRTDYPLYSLVQPGRLRRPHRLLLEVYRRKHIISAARSYEQDFALADDGTSRRLQDRREGEGRSGGSTSPPSGSASTWQSGQ